MTPIAQVGVPLVEATRGGMVESVHLGVIAVADVDGHVTFAAGEPELVTFPRSALKPFQLLALVDRGGIDRFGFTSDEVAVMVGSHSGEPMHLERVTRILEKIDAPESALACGVQVPFDPRAAAELTRSGAAPRALHNNCSGKHAGMLALARLLGAPIEGYIDPEHAAQRAIKDAIADALGVAADALVIGIDGCSAPAFGLPMRAMARGFSLLAAPERTPERWRGPFGAISSAMRRYPELVGGSHQRLDTELMRLPRHLVSKSGAEGYFCVGHADGLGMAVKIADGDGGARARGLATVAAALWLGWIGEADLGDALRFFGPRIAIRNLAGRETGEVRPARGWAD